MKISAKGRYALRLMIDLARTDAGKWTSLRDISLRQGISVKYLEQIVTILCREGLLRSSRGPLGGYMLSRPAAEYGVGEIIRATEGTLAPVACLDDSCNRCPRAGACPTLPIWEGLHEVVNRYLDSVTLEQVARDPAGGDKGDANGA